MFTDRAAAALLALVLLSAMFADAGSAALLALNSPAVVLADDLTMAVPAHCTTALGLAAAAAAVARTSAGSTSATGTASAVLLQPVDQLLLLPGLPHSRVRAELLQLRDGLRAGKHTRWRVSRIEGRAVSCGKRRCGQGSETAAVKQ
jgi:hypothetical protein